MRMDSGRAQRAATLSLVLALVLILIACTSSPTAPPPTGTPAIGTPTTGPATASPTQVPTITVRPTPPSDSATAYPEPATTESYPGLAADDTAPVFTYRIVATYPHDPDAFTQGLAYEPEGILYEGTGLRGESTLRKVELETGEVLQMRRLEDEYFGEGITLLDDRIVQLTWQSNLGFVYDKTNFELLHEFEYPTEGWGLTYDGTQLIMSDGTATLYFLDPTTFEEVRTVEVRDGSDAVTHINELEYIDGEIYANVWKTDRIARISPETGQVTAWIDLSGLLPPEVREQQRVDVLNGIAYDAINDRLFVTGKWWPTLFQIELVQEGT